nr:RecName: Full=Choline oxidase [Alcaligenes sp.]
DNPNHSR